MTTTTATTGSATARFDHAFAAVIGFCAEFCAGARQGREMEFRYVELARKSTPELSRLGLTRADIGRAALNGTRHS
jgi:uncharacterized protein YjiS (DUF1127 family)